MQRHINTNLSRIITVILLMLAFLAPSGYAADKPTVTIDRIEGDSGIITIHYTTSELQDTKLVTTNWAYSADDGKTWKRIDGAAIGRNEPKAPGNSIILWDTTIGANNLADEYYPSVLFRMQVSDMGSWRTIASMPTARDGLAGAAVGGKIYALGGYDASRKLDLSTIEEYDPAANRWRSVGDMPTARDSFAAAAVNGKLYVLGGWGDGRLSTVEEYDPATNSWRSVADMPTARDGLATAVVNERLYALGGWDGSRQLSTVEEYDPATNSWRSVADMPTARDTLAAAAVNGKLYALGGRNSRKYLLSTVEEYDPAANRWRSVADMPTARNILAAAAVNGKLYAIGGWDGSRQLSTVEEYDPATNSWRSVADMPTARDFLASVAVNGKLYALGGWDGSRDLSIVEEFTPPRHSEIVTSDYFDLANGLYIVKVSAEPSSIFADGSSRAQILVKLIDRDTNRAVTDEAITLSTTLGKLDNSSATHYGYGIYGGTFTAGTRHGTARITAEISNGQIGQTMLQLIPSAKTITVSANPTSIIADGKQTSQIRISVQSFGEEPITDETVSLSVDKGAIDKIAVHQNDGIYTASYTAPLLSENSDVTITAKTSNGKVGTVAITLIRPTIWIKAPENNANLSGTIDVTGWATSSKLQTWILDCASGDNPADGDFLSPPIKFGMKPTEYGLLSKWDTSILPDGAATLRLRVTESDGKRHTFTVVVNVDNTHIELVSPEANATLEGTVTVEGTVSSTSLRGWILDCSPGKNPGSNDYLTPPIKSNKGADVLVSWDTTTLGDGTYTLRLRAIANSGYVETDTVVVRLDNTYAELTSPSDGVMVEGIVAIKGTAASGVLREWILDCAPGKNPKAKDYIAPPIKRETKRSVTSGLLANWSTTTLDDGIYTLRLRVFEKTGEIETATRLVEINNQPPPPPTVIATSPHGNYITHNDILKFSGTLPADTSFLSAALLNPDGVSIRDVSRFVQIDGSSISGEVNVGNLAYVEALCLGVIAEDVMGKQSEYGKSQLFAVDSDVPSITINEPVKGAYLQKPPIHFAGSITDRRGVKKVEFKLHKEEDWRSVNLTGSEWFYDFTPTIPEFIYTAKVRAIDFVGHISPVESITINYFTFIPAANIRNPTDGATISGTVSILGSAGGAYVVEYSRADAEDWIEITRSEIPVDNGELCKWNASGLDGIYKIRLTVGEKSVERKNITVIPPEVIELGIAKISKKPAHITTGSRSNIVTITYTAETPINRGKISITMPDDWSKPQKKGGSAGYTTIESTGILGNPTFNEQTVIIPVQRLQTGETITVIYGRGGGASGVVIGAKGTAKFIIKAQVSEIAELTELSEQPTVVVHPVGSRPEAATVTLKAKPAILIANGKSTSTITITVKSVDNKPVTDETVSLYVELGKIPNKATNKGDGIYTAEYTSAAVPGKVIIIATTSSGKSGTVEIELTERKISQANSSVIATPDKEITADGTSYYEITITVVDEQNNPMSGKLVTVSATGEYNTIIQPTSPTNADGITTAKLSSTKAEIKTITAKVGGTLVGQTTVEFVTGQPEFVIVESSADKLVADGISTADITVTVMDAHENSINDQIVTLTAELGTVKSPGTDNGDGTYTSIYTAPKTAEGSPDTIHGFVPNGRFGKVEIELLEHRANASQSEVRAGGSYPADGKTPVTVSVILRDDKGEAVAGKVVEIVVTPEDGVQISQPTKPTDAKGKTTATFTSTKAGIKTVTAFDVTDGISLEGSAHVILEPGPAAAVLVTALQTRLEADGKSGTKINITVEDTHGNFVKDEVVTMSATSGSIQSLADNNGDGTYSANYTASTKKDDVTVRATTSNGVQGTVKLTLVAKDTVAEIKSVEVNIDRNGMSVDVAKASDKIRVTLVGEPKGTATFSIDRVVDRVTMSEGLDGIYVGEYTVNDGDDVANAVITVTLHDAKGNIGSDFSQTVIIDTTPPPAPQDLELIGGSINALNVANVQIKGKTTAKASVTITLKDGVNTPIEVREKADSSGMFIVSVDATMLQDGKITVTAVEVDDLAGNPGLPAEITVTKNIQQKFPPSFQLTATSTSKRGEHSGTVSYNLSIVGVYGFDREVKLSFANLPTGVSAKFDPKTVVPSPAEPLQSTQLILNIGVDAQVGSHDFTVLATGGSEHQEISLSLDVVESLIPATINIFVNPNPVPYGKPIKVFGDLTLEGKPNEAFEITLTYKSPIGKTMIQYVDTDVNGAYESTFNQSDKLGTWKVVASFDDARYQHAERSKSFEVIKGTSKIKWLDVASTVTIGTSTTINGKLDPPLENEKIFLRVQRPNEAETPLETATTNENGLFSIEQTFNEPDEWKYTAIWNGNDFYNDVRETIAIQVVKDVGKAIIVHGGGNEDNNTNWEIYRRTADYVHESFKKRHFRPEEDIYYLSPSENPDPAIVDGLTTKINLQKAIEWAKGQVSKHVPLYIYLISHNTREDFLLEMAYGRDDVYLTPDELNDWLKDEISPDVPITIIIEACYSGRWIKVLAGENRVIISSASQRTQAEVRLTTSFTRFFLNEIVKNRTVEKAFLLAKETTEGNIIHSEQHPRIDADGDGKPNQANDFASVADVYLPDNFASLSQPPKIESATVVPKRLDEGISTAKISAKVKGEDITEVTATVVPPTFDPKAYFEQWHIFDEFHLIDPDGDGVYEGSYDKFNQTGVYTIMISAEDAYGNITLPIQVNLPVGIEPSPWDVNNDGIVDIRDLSIIGSNFGKTGANLAGDVNGDGVADISDLVLVGAHLGGK